VSDRRLRRFLHLERPRPADAGKGEGEGDLPSPGGGRFEGVERPRGDVSAPVGAPPHTGAQLDRFGPEPEPPIELVDTERTRPFTRCMRCGADSNFAATECAACGASLDAPEQREWSERFWAERQAEAERETRAEAERRELAARAEADEARARRAVAEELARQVGELERRRLEADEGGGGLGLGRDARPLGLRLLRLIPDARWRLAAGIACAALVLGLVVNGLGALGHRQRSASFAVGLVLLVVLALPAGVWRRRW
jgi:hypothetical protein